MQRSTARPHLLTASLHLALLAASLGAETPQPALAQTQSTQPQAPAAKAGGGAEPLYDELLSVLSEFETGIEMIASGQTWLGDETLDNAVRRLERGSSACLATAGCDPEPFFAAYGRLLLLQSEALKAQRSSLSRLEEGEPETSEAEAGRKPFHGTMPQLDRAVNLLRGTELGDLISLNGPVSAALDDWLTWMRPDLMAAYRHYQYLRPGIAPIYREAGLPEALLFAMIATESRGKVHAVSGAGAAGPLQFMSRTGYRYGLKQIDGFDLRFDPESATRANVAYLNEHFELFNNSLEKVLAAYNGGENRMKGIQRRYGDASFWDRSVYYSFPRETREYVPRVLAAAWLFLHPEDYNLEFPVIDASITRLRLKRESSLSELTICLGQQGGADEGWFRELRNLNPRIEPSDRLEAGTLIQIPGLLSATYESTCLDGELVEKARRLFEANYPEKPPMIPYFVRAGDTLSSIAGRFSCASMGEIAALNNISPPRYVIRKGQRLLIPDCR